MKTYLFVLTISLLLQTKLSYALESAQWGDLSSWVGQNPVKANGEDILQLPKVKIQLSKILNPADRKLLAAYEESPPIRSEEGVIIIEKCRPHNCPAERALVVLDTKVSRLWVGFFERKEGKVSSRWIGNVDDYTILSEKIRIQLPK